MGKSRQVLLRRAALAAGAAEPSPAGQPPPSPLPERGAAAAETSGRREEELLQQQQQQHQQEQPRRYLAYFLHRLLDFREPELRALASMAGAGGDVRIERPAGSERESAELSPFWHVTLPGDDVARRVAERGVLLRGLFDVWGEGATLGEALDAVDALDAACKAPYLAADTSFRVLLDAWGFKWSPAERAELVRTLDARVPFEGRVDLSSAARHTFWLICQQKLRHNGLPDLPTRWFFARQVGLADRALVDVLSLKRRLYIGPTAMDPELALLMANMGRVRRGGLVLDPYVGTGSLLVAAAARGAFTVGADIDVRVLRPAVGGAAGGAALDPATNEPPNAASNFRQYGLTQPLGLLRLDVHTPPFRRDLEEVFDAVLADPPYGVRAGGRKSAPRPAPAAGKAAATAAAATAAGAEGEGGGAANGHADAGGSGGGSAGSGGAVQQQQQPPPKPPQGARGAAYIPSTQPYTLTECLADLLELAARTLVVGGRLVFFVPAAPDSYREDELPAHPALTTIANSEQLLTARYSRRLVTMEKVQPYDAAAAAEARAAKEGFVMAADRLHELVYAQEPGRVSVRRRAKQRRRQQEREARQQQQHGREEAGEEDKDVDDVDDDDEEEEEEKEGARGGGGLLNDSVAGEAAGASLQQPGGAGSSDGAPPAAAAACITRIVKPRFRSKNV